MATTFERPSFRDGSNKVKFNPSAPPYLVISIILGLILSVWLGGMFLFYWHLFPLRLSHYFASFFSQFGYYEGFNYGLILDLIYLTLIFWFAFTIGFILLVRGGMSLHSPLQTFVLASSLGLLFLGMFTFFVGIVGFLHSWLFHFLVIFSIPVLSVIITSPKYHQSFVQAFSTKPRGASGFPLLRLIVMIILLIVLCITFLYTLTPPIQSDGLRYHLAAPQEYIKHHRIHYIPFSAFSNFPFLIEMLFTLGMLLRSDILAKLIHFSLMLLSVLTLLLIWEEFLLPEFQKLIGTNENPFLRLPHRLILALLFLSTPAISIVGCWSFIEHGVNAFFLLLIYSLLRFIKIRNQKELNLAAIYAGAVLSTKYTMLAVVMFAILWLFFTLAIVQKEKLTRTVYLLLRFTIIAFLIASPWFVKNAINTGNPVYPFAWRIFDGGEWSTKNATLYRNKTKEKGFPPSISTFLTIPWDTAIYWHRFGNFNPGPLYLLTFPFLVAFALLIFLRTSTREFLSLRTVCYFAFTYLLFWFFTYQSNRFLIPVLILAIPLVLIVTMKIYHFWRPLAAVMLTVVIGASLYGSLWTVRWILTEAYPHPLPVVLGFESRRLYLTKALNYYPSAMWLNKNVGLRGGKVLFIGEHRTYYFDKVEIFASDWFDTPVILYAIRRTKDNEELFHYLKEKGVRYILYNREELLIGRQEELYYRPRFTEKEWIRYQEFLCSPRLSLLWQCPGHQIYIFNISYE